MKYFEKIADLEKWIEDRSDVLSKIDSPKVKIIESIAKEKWGKNWEQLKDLVARKYNALKKSIIGE
jgi:hypothetical protein